MSSFVYAVVTRTPSIVVVVFDGAAADDDDVLAANPRDDEECEFLGASVSARPHAASASATASSRGSARHRAVSAAAATPRAPRLRAATARRRMTRPTLARAPGVPRVGASRVSETSPDETSNPGLKRAAPAVPVAGGSVLF